MEHLCGPCALTGPTERVCVRVSACVRVSQQAVCMCMCVRTCVCCGGLCVSRQEVCVLWRAVRVSLYVRVRVGSLNAHLFCGGQCFSR